MKLLITIDAMHTQTATARLSRRYLGRHYRMVCKDNQPTTSARLPCPAECADQSRESQQARETDQLSTYQSLTPLNRDDALELMSSSDKRAAAEAILRSAAHDPDGGWVTDRALELINSSDAQLRTAAATALGHVARIHRSIDQARVVPALRLLLDDPTTAGRAEDALDDIELFANRQ